MQTYTIEYHGRIYRGNGVHCGRSGRMSGLSAENVRNQIVNYRERYNNGENYDTYWLKITAKDIDNIEWHVDIDKDAGIFDPEKYGIE